MTVVSGLLNTDSDGNWLTSVCGVGVGLGIGEQQLRRKGLKPCVLLHVLPRLKGGVMHNWSWRALALYFIVQLDAIIGGIKFWTQSGGIKTASSLPGNGRIEFIIGEGKTCASGAIPILAAVLLLIFLLSIIFSKF